MILYDQNSDIEWFYDGRKTAEEMRADQRYALLFETDCVLYDNGRGKVYGFEPLESIATRLYVPLYNDAEHTFEQVMSKMNGTWEPIETGVDPQIETIARLVAPEINFTSVTTTDVVAIPDYIPEWKDVKHFEQNDPCKYNNTIYRASQAHDRQDIYPPDVAGESMYYPIEVAEDGIIVYRTCHGAYDQVHAGEKRHYPTATDPVYQAKVDTAYDPSTRPDDWQLVE